MAKKQLNKMEKIRNDVVQGMKRNKTARKVHEKNYGKNNQVPLEIYERDLDYINASIEKGQRWNGGILR